MTQTVMSVAEVAPDRETEKLTFQQYLFYEGEPDVLYELVRGTLIPMPSQSHLHTNIVKFLVHKLQRHFAAENLDLVANPLGTGVRTEQASSRIPDLVVCSQRIWEQVIPRAGAGVLDLSEKPDLVVEIVSTNRRSDYATKRNEYETAEIPEYWIVDPKKSRVRVFTNPTGEEGYSWVDFSLGEQIVSSQFPKLVLSVEEMLSPPLAELLVKEELAQSQEFQQRAEEQEQRAEAERQRAEEQEQRAEAERQRAEKLAQRLLELGVNPEEID